MKRSKIWMVGVVGALFAAAPGVASAGEYTIYMNWNQLSVKGNATEAAHKDWIEVRTLVLQMSRPISSASGASSREAGVPKITDLLFTKSLDAATLPLTRAALAGKGVPVVLEILKQGTKVMRITLSNALITSSSSNVADSGQAESLGLNFTRIVWEHFPDGKTAGKTQVTYDLATNKAS